MTYGSVTGESPYWEGHKTQLYWRGADRPKGTKDPVELVRPHPFWKSILEGRQHRLSAMYNHDYNYYSEDNPEHWVNPEEWGWPNGVFPEAIYGLPPPVPDPWSSNDDLALLVGLKEEVAGGSANVAVTIAEMGETLDSLASVAKRLAKLTDDARRFGPKKTTWYKARSLAKKYGKKIYRNGIGKTLKDGWLEYRYAVMPLMYDIDAHCQTLANLHNRPQRNRFRQTRRVSDTGAISSGGGVYWGPRKIKHSCRVVADIKSGPAKYLVYSGVSDPASVLWEKIPYSFVADWILPVGDFLNAVDFVRKFEGDFVFTHKVEQTCKGFFTRPDDKGRELWRFSNGGDYLYRYLTIDRQVTSSPPVPYPSLDTAIGKSKTSLRRALDAVSLFAYPRLEAGY